MAGQQVMVVLNLYRQDWFLSLLGSGILEMWSDLSGFHDQLCHVFSPGNFVKLVNFVHWIHVLLQWVSPNSFYRVFQGKHPVWCFLPWVDWWVVNGFFS